MRSTAVACLTLSLGVHAAQDRPVEKELVMTITAVELRAGIVSEILWDRGMVMVQGVFAQPDGALKAHYFVRPADGVELKPLEAAPPAAVKYWEMKSNRMSPTGLGRIESSSDTKLPMYGVGSMQRRVFDAVDMGGTSTRYVLQLGDLTLLERSHGAPPYDGETYSWSPAELNRIAYVDGKGDLWIAAADGRSPRRILKGQFTLPAWSDDGQLIAVAERKDGGRRWEVSVVHLPADLRSPLQRRTPRP
jgi:hypothetical protein